MEGSVLLNDLLCSKSTSQLEQHVMKEPIGLDCGHCICKSCASTGASFEIRCNKCGVVNQKDLRNAKPLILFEKMIETSLRELYKEIGKQTLNNIAKLKSLTASREEATKINVNYIEEEIEIRIESMKIELDKLFEILKAKLEAQGKKIIEEKTQNASEDEFKIKDYEDKLNELRSHLKSKEPLDKEKFYNYQNLLITLKKEVNQLELNYKDLLLEFTPSSKNVNETLIGEIHFRSSTLTPKKMKEIIENKEFETIAVNGKYYDSLVLNDNRLLCSSNLSLQGYDNHDDDIILENNQFLFSTDNKLELYDEWFNLVKNISLFNHDDYDGISTIGIAFNDAKSSIYISDHINHRIIMTDAKLNFIKSFGSYGNGNRNFNQPFGISFNDICLYICDYNNQRIQILTSELRYHNSIRLGYNPYTIKISSKTIGVCGNTGTYFYDLATLSLKSSYTGILGRINFIDSHFYVISYSPRKVIYVYDENGSSLNEINIDKLYDNVTSSWDGTIAILKNELFFVLYNQKKILKYKTNMF